VGPGCQFFRHFLRALGEDSAGLPNSVTGVDLMTAAFKQGAVLALATGEVTSENEGWHHLALGLMKAARNSAGHRTEDRDDARTYAMGVLGAISLLMTQARYEHPTSWPMRSSPKIN
jgi:Protein of unknown function (Hypoth_ymh)